MNDGPYPRKRLSEWLLTISGGLWLFLAFRGHIWSVVPLLTDEQHSGTTLLHGVTTGLTVIHAGLMATSLVLCVSRAIKSTRLIIFLASSCLVSGIFHLLLNAALSGITAKLAYLLLVGVFVLAFWLFARSHAPR